jgi:hypothetical protein
MSESRYSSEISRPTQSIETRTLPPELESSYLHQRDRIKELYQNVWVWHGTGRYDRRNNKTVDILDEILSLMIVDALQASYLIMMSGQEVMNKHQYQQR